MAPFAKLRIAPGANNAIMGSLITLSKYHSICDDDDNDDDDDDDDDDEQDVLLWFIFMAAGGATSGRYCTSFHFRSNYGSLCTLLW